MNRRLFVLTMAAVSLMACDKEEVMEVPSVSGEYIEFGMPSVGLDVETRAPLNQLAEGTSFGVLGYCLAQTQPGDTTLNTATGSVSWDTKKSLCRPHVFYKQEVAYSGGICSYSPLVPWLADDYRYSFFAYYPYGDGKGFTVTTGESTLGAPSVKFSIPFDSMDEDTELDDAQVPDAMVAQSIDVIRNTGQVQLNFLHLLTGLNFQVNNYNATDDGATPGDPVTIHSLKLKGTFYKSIEINFDNNYVFPSETFRGTYTLLGDSEDDDITIGGLESVSQIGGKTLLLVSNLKETGVEDGYLGDLDLVIEYTFGSGKSKFVTKTRPENFQPSGGTIYTAQLNFIGDSFVLNFVVDNDQKWEDGGDSEITFE